VGGSRDEPLCEDQVWGGQEDLGWIENGLERKTKPGGKSSGKGAQLLSKELGNHGRLATVGFMI
jgi:hypothetical protein